MVSFRPPLLNMPCDTSSTTSSIICGAYVDEGLGGAVWPVGGDDYDGSTDEDCADDMVAMAVVVMARQQGDIFFNARQTCLDYTQCLWRVRAAALTPAIWLGVDRWLPTHLSGWTPNGNACWTAQAGWTLEAST